MSALHLCIDMQIWEMKKFDPDDARIFRAAVTHANQRFADKGVETLYVAFTDSLETIPDPIGNILGSFRDVQRSLLKRGDRALIDLPAPENAIAATKTDYSAGKAKPIADYIAAKGALRLFLSGAWEATDNDHESCCVTATAIDFQKAGYAVSIVAEATNAAFKPSLNLAKRQKLHRPHGVRVEPLAAILQSL